VFLVNMKKSRGLREGIYSVNFRADQAIGLRAISKRWREVHRAFPDPEVLRRAQAVIVLSGNFPLAARNFRRNRLAPIFVDLTQPGAALDRGRIPLFVVRAIVPGLVPIDFGFGTEALGVPGARASTARSGGKKSTRILFPHSFA